MIHGLTLFFFRLKSWTYDVSVYPAYYLSFTASNNINKVCEMISSIQVQTFNAFRTINLLNLFKKSLSSFNRDKNI